MALDLATRFRRIEAQCNAPELESIRELARDTREALKNQEWWFHRHPNALERIGDIAAALESLLRQRAEAK